jgi:hypothetical protein
MNFFQALVIMLFWELFGVNLCSLVGVKLGMQELAELSAETRDIALSHGAVFRSRTGLHLCRE